MSVAALRFATEACGRVRLAMRGNSMLPLLHEPMVLDVAPLRRRARFGEVIVFAEGERWVVHRVLGYTADGYITGGDALPDLTESPTLAAVLGRVRAVWSDDSAAARRVDGPLFRIRSAWYARRRMLRALYARRRA